MHSTVSGADSLKIFEYAEFLETNSGD